MRGRSDDVQRQSSDLTEGGRSRTTWSWSQKLGIVRPPLDGGETKYRWPASCFAMPRHLYVGLRASLAVLVVALALLSPSLSSTFDSHPTLPHPLAFVTPAMAAGATPAQPSSRSHTQSGWSSITVHVGNCPLTDLVDPTTGYDYVDNIDQCSHNGPASGSPPKFAITFLSHPALCGLAFNGTGENNGTSRNFTAGSYPASANGACSHFSFLQWNTTGGVTVSSSSSASTQAAVNGNGTLLADYAWTGGSGPPASYNLVFSIHPPACGPVLFNGTTYANGASASFPAGTYLAHAPACAGGWTFEEWVLAPATLGNIVDYYTPWANISVSGQGYLSADYLPPPLQVALTPSAPSTSVGTPLSLTPTVSGGISPYTCVWSLNGTNTSQTGCSSLSLSWAHPGTYTYRVWATDASPQVAGSNAVSVAVSAGPAPLPLVAFGNGTVSGYPGACGAGGIPGVAENVSFTGNARGGVPPYTFSWTFGDGSASVSGRNVTHGYATLGDQNGTLKVTDASGASVLLQVPVLGPKSPAFSCPAQGVTPAYPFGLTAAGFDLLIALSLAVAVVVALAVLVLARRRKMGRRAGASPPGEPSPKGDSERP